MNTEHPTPRKKDLLLILILLLMAAALWAGHHFRQRPSAPPEESTISEAHSDTSAPAEGSSESEEDAPGDEEGLPPLRAEVTIDGELHTVLDLSKDQEVTVEGPGGGTNHLIVQDGEIWCDDASCPDKVCIYQGHQSIDGDIIVCLPNLMIVQIIQRGTAPQ